MIVLSQTVRNYRIRANEECKLYSTRVRIEIHKGNILNDVHKRLFLFEIELIVYIY